MIDARSVTTEFNTLFETVTSIAEKVSPIELNATLSALAQALDGLGGKFGESIVNGNQILAQLNPRMPQIRYDVRRLADLAGACTQGRTRPVGLPVQRGDHRADADPATG